MLSLCGLVGGGAGWPYYHCRGRWVGAVNYHPCAKWGTEAESTPLCSGGQHWSLFTRGVCSTQQRCCARWLELSIQIPLPTMALAKPSIYCGFPVLCFPWILYFPPHYSTNKVKSLRFYWMAVLIPTLSLPEDKAFPGKQTPYPSLNLWSRTLSGVWWHLSSFTKELSLLLWIPALSFILPTVRRLWL